MSKTPEPKCPSCGSHSFWYHSNGKVECKICNDEFDTLPVPEEPAIALWHPVSGPPAPKSSYDGKIPIARCTNRRCVQVPILQIFGGTKLQRVLCPDCGSQTDGFIEPLEAIARWNGAVAHDERIGQH